MEYPSETLFVDAIAFLDEEEREQCAKDLGSIHEKREIPVRYYRPYDNTGSCDCISVTVFFFWKKK
jgi:hypothetical protein